MNTAEIIKKKRDRGRLDDAEIKFLIDTYTKGRLPDYQFSAFLMAAFINGLDDQETAQLTHAMLYSGKRLDLSAIPGMKIDKHSTGGVGDKTSLIIAPVAASAGIIVPMISGRGLGHTGGTLDKLESITGFKTNLSLNKFKSLLRESGAALIGQTREIAPADRLIYALRDVTATIESIPLITSSIMSKKLAEGAGAFVFDIKTGSGAFMNKFSDANALANSLLNTAARFNLKSIAMITDMNQPLGQYIGNWLEVVESIRILEGERIEGLWQLSMNLAGAMLLLGGKVESLDEGIEYSENEILSGRAYDKFLEIVKNQGGDPELVGNPKKYPKSRIKDKIYFEKSGFVKSVDTYRLGIASMMLGAGREKKEGLIDHKAGIIFFPKIGHEFKKGDPIAEIFTDRKKNIDIVKKMIRDSIGASDKPSRKIKLIKKTLTNY